MIKILLVDDHAVFRQGLRQIVSAQWPQAQFGEAQSAIEALQALRRQAWDAMFLDLGLPGRSGLELLKEVKSERSQMPILVMSMQPEDQYGLRVLKTGAAGYLNKASAPEHVVAALRKVLSGGKYISPSLAETLAGGLDDKDGPRHAALSDREFEVMCLIASGQTISRIADDLALNVKTVGTYRARILEKMKMKTNAEMTYYAIRNNLVD